MWGLGIILESGSSLLESSQDRWMRVTNLPAHVHLLESHGQLKMLKAWLGLIWLNQYKEAKKMSN
jgi:hypothetical protein